MSAAMKLKNVPDWSVVRVSDGRVGAFYRKGPGNKPVVMLAGNLGTQVALSDEVTVIRYPAQLAQQFVEEGR